MSLKTGSWKSCCSLTSLPESYRAKWLPSAVLPRCREGLWVMWLAHDARLSLYINTTWGCNRNLKQHEYWRRIKIIYGTLQCNSECVFSLSSLSLQRMVKRWAAAAVQAGNSVIAFSVPKAGPPALNQKSQSLLVMAQLIIKHVSYLRWAAPIYFHLSDRDGCTNSIGTINKRSINISSFLQKQITQLAKCPMSGTLITQRLIKR